MPANDCLEMRRARRHRHARHAGHADFLREAADGLVGEDAPREGIEVYEIRPQAESGQTRKKTVPIIAERGTNPQYRLSHEPGWLSPRTK